MGYKELFSYFDGTIDQSEAIRLIQRNSRHYARKQLSWWRRNPEICWFHPDDWESIVKHILTEGATQAHGDPKEVF